MASTRHAKYRRRGTQALSLSTPEKYRLLITFPGSGGTRHFSTNDLARARSVARRNASNGAHVAFQRHEGWGRFTTTNTYAPEPR